MLHFDEWIQTDRKLMNQYEVIQVFREFQCSLDLWQGKTFLEKGEYGGEYQMSGTWDKLAGKCSDDGIEVQQVMVRVPCIVNLRSLAVEVKLNTRISFHSSLYIFTRVVEKISENTPALRIYKDANLRALFFVFGFLEPGSRKFKFVKQKQITETVKFSEPHRDLEVSIIDNGNDKIYINISNSLNPCIENFYFCCSGFLPETRDSQIWVAGTGDKVSIRNLSVQYKQRIDLIKPQSRSGQCTCIVL